MTKGAFVGGEIVMHVQFVSSDPFKRIRLDLPVIDGVRSEVLARANTRQIEVLSDEGYTVSGGKGYSHEARLAIVPMESGIITIPPIIVTGISEPSSGRTFEFEKIFPEQKIVVHPKSPDFGGDAWIVSHNVTMKESWSHTIREIQSGDTVRRRVVMTVAGVTAEDLPELNLTSNSGYRVLNTDLSIETEKTDNGLIAHLDQSWDIYVEAEDVTYIDAVRFRYWNPELARAEEASVPRQRVEPLPRDALELREQMREQALAEHRTKRLGLMALLSLPAAALIGLFGLFLWGALPTRADLKFWRDARQPGAPLEFYGTFLSWLGGTFGSRTPVGQDQISALGARASDQVEKLHQSIFGPRGGAFDTKRVAGTLIWASRRNKMTRFASAIMPGVARFLFLR